MDNKKIIISAFIVVALVQLYIPLSMVFSQEDILLNGTEHKFKTAPVDPNDPFRGKYITLRFDDNTFDIKEGENWIAGEAIFLTLTKDQEGYSSIKEAFKEQPYTNDDFIEAKVRRINYDTTQVIINYPFNRFYMEESKAYEAELKYNESNRDTTQTTYALVNVKEGKSTLVDVMIDGISIKELVESVE